MRPPDDYYAAVDACARQYLACRPRREEPEFFATFISQWRREAKGKHAWWQPVTRWENDVLFAVRDLLARGSET